MGGLAYRLGDGFRLPIVRRERHPKPLWINQRPLSHVTSANYRRMLSFVRLLMRSPFGMYIETRVGQWQPKVREADAGFKP